MGEAREAMECCQIKSAAERRELDQNDVDSALADSLAASLAFPSFPELLSCKNNNSSSNTSRTTDQSRGTLGLT